MGPTIKKNASFGIGAMYRKKSTSKAAEPENTV